MGYDEVKCVECKKPIAWHSSQSQKIRPKCPDCCNKHGIYIDNAGNLVERDYVLDFIREVAGCPKCSTCRDAANAILEMHNLD